MYSLNDFCHSKDGSTCRMYCCTHSCTKCLHSWQVCRVLLLQLLLAGVDAQEHLEGTIADPELLMEVSVMCCFKQAEQTCRRS